MVSTFFRVALGREVVHEIYRNRPGDDYETGLDDLGTEPLAPVWPTLSIVCKDRQQLPDWFKSGTKPIVSDRFKAICGHFPVVAEFLPMRIVRPAGLLSPSMSYWVLHPLEEIDCIDVEQSDFEMYGTPPRFTVKRYQKLVFRPEVLGERALFRPQHDPAIYCSSAFRDAVLAEKLVVSFKPLPGA